MACIALKRLLIRPTDPTAGKLERTLSPRAWELRKLQRHLHGSTLHSMDEAGQREFRGRARSIQLAEMSGLGIDISCANRSSLDNDSMPASLHNTKSAENSGLEHTPSSAQPLLSPPSTGGLSGATQFGQSPASTFSPYSYKAHPKTYSTYSHSTTNPPPPQESQSSLLQKHHSASLHSAYGDFATKHRCDGVTEMKGTRRNWLYVVAIVLSAYSSVMSCLFAFVAVDGPSWKTIRTHGRLSPSTAALLTTAVAKTVELSFVSTIIFLLGQQLARKAHSRRRRSGVTLAELNMRGWLLQPFTLLSRWESVRYAGITGLGLISIVSALFAMLYTPAAAALVQPQLKFGGWKESFMQGRVRTAFGNAQYIKENCYTPVPTEIDPAEHANTCAHIEHAAMAYKNYFTYLGLWSTGIEARSASPHARPNGTALFSNDTTVIAPWVGNKLDHTAAFTDENTGIIVNNVSIAFPHAGVVTAAKDPSNNIAQPEDLDGVGRYTINASVVSPVLHSLCATVSEEQISPLVFSTWNTTEEPLNQTTWPAQLTFSESRPSPYLNGTELDGIFGWGEKYGDYNWPPIFMKLPEDYNTLVNGTGNGGLQYGRSSVYVLGKAHSTDLQEDSSSGLDYFLCQLQVSQSPYCYTSYQASGQTAVLEAVCDETDTRTGSMRYMETNDYAPDGNATISRDWPMVASEMVHALALNDGAFDGKSANARLLSQLMLREPHLDPAKPSLAEALAVLAGNTLLQSTVDAPFIHYWEYAADMSENGILLASDGAPSNFSARIRAQEYASGGTSQSQKSFLIVLLGVFALNFSAFCYFVVHKTWYKDFSEPQNLFTLAVNSPPSEVFSGCCGTELQGKDYGVAWTLESDGGHVFVHGGVRSELDVDTAVDSPRVKRRKVWSSSVAGSPLVKGLGEKLKGWTGGKS